MQHLSLARGKALSKDRAAHCNTGLAEFDCHAADADASDGPKPSSSSCDNVLTTRKTRKNQGRTEAGTG